jgi:hypothetical protein
MRLKKKITVKMPSVLQRISSTFFGAVMHKEKPTTTEKMEDGIGDLPKQSAKVQTQRVQTTRKVKIDKL